MTCYFMVLYQQLHYHHHPTPTTTTDSDAGCCRITLTMSEEICEIVLFGGSN